MPLKSKAGRRHYNRGYMQNYRQRQRDAKQPAKVELISPADPVTALASWSRSVLVVPVGHARAGEPLVIPDYGLRFLADALAHRYSLLSVARKNGKSALIACYLLSRLCGPLRFPGWRGGVVSVSREKSLELKMQVQAISEASGLADVKVWRAPVIESSTGRLDFLSADKSAGAASGFDDALVDELGLLAERDRELVSGMRSSISARDGRFIAISIMGRSPFTREMVEQREDPATCCHVYQADRDAALDDPEAWYVANPGLNANIKSLAYMQDEARRVLAVPCDQNDFRAQELNLPVDPGKEMVCSLLDFQLCVGGDAERDGHCVAAFDLGGSSSMCAFVALWPWSGRCEVYGAFPGIPNLRERGQADGVSELYERLHAAGELEVFDGHRATPVSVFLERCFARLEGETVLAVGCDRYRRAEAETAMSHAGLEGVPMQWRGQGAHAVADGSHDVRAFQRSILQYRLRVVRGAGLLAHAISESSVRHDQSGNPALEKGRGKGRIDPLQACVIASGLGELVEAHGPPSPCRMVTVG